MKRALVIGAGPAGTIAALSLARREDDVTLVEQHRFPRDKVCGECLSALGKDVLERMGLWEEIQRCGAVELNATMLYGPAGECAELPLNSAMWGITRRRLDDVLMQNAMRAGVKVLQPARCETIEQMRARVRMLANNDVRSIDADCIFLADGKGMLAGDRPKATGDFGIKAHFADVDAPANSIGLYALGGHYVGVAPVEGGLWNVAFSAPLAKVKRFERDFDGLLRAAIKENRTLALHFSRARRAGEWLAAALPRFAVKDDWPSGIIPIGNAAAALEPIGGEGMGLAMRSAEIAVENFENDCKIRRDFSRLWAVRRAACRIAAMAMSRAAISGAAVELVAANIAIAQRVMALMGKYAIAPVGEKSASE